MNIAKILSSAMLTMMVAAPAQLWAAPVPVTTARSAVAASPVRTTQLATQPTRSVATHSSSFRSVNPPTRNQRSVDNANLYKAKESRVSPLNRPMHGSASDYDDGLYASPDEAEYGPDLDLVATSDDDYIDETQPVKIEFGLWRIAEPFSDNGREKSAWQVLSSVRFVKVISDGEIIDYCVEYGPVSRTHDGIPVNGPPKFIEPTEDCELIYEMEQSQGN